VNAYLFEIGSLNGETNVLREFYDNRWTPENPNNEYTKKVNPSERNVFSDAQVEDASFLRVKNVTIGYNLSEKSLKKMKLGKLQGLWQRQQPVHTHRLQRVMIRK
jgi:hypothetical protein